MGKTFKEKTFEEEQEDFQNNLSEISRQITRDKRKERRIARALKTKNVDELLEYDEWGD